MKEKINFAIINPTYDTVETTPQEREYKKGDYISWGSDNRYPNLLFDIMRNATNMNTIINTVIDYVCGEGDVMHEVITDELIHDIAESYAIYGGFAIDVAKNNAGEISRVECLDMRYIRTDKTHSFVVYNEDFANASGYISSKKSIILPTQANKNAQEYVYLFINSHYTIYPRPVWESAVKECLIEMSISDYHFNAIKNGLNDTVVFKFNDGKPEDEEKAEIEKAIDDKFCGSENAGRPIISYADSKDNQLELDTISTANWGDKYIALVDHIKEKQYASWRMAPSLCGIAERGTGFNSTEYQEQYALFFANVIRPIQKKIEKVLSEIFSVKCTIEPMKVEFPEAI